MKDDRLPRSGAGLLLLVLLLLLGATGARAASPVTITDAWAPAGGTAIYLTIENASDDPDRLIGATTPSAGAVTLRSVGQAAVASPLLGVVIPAHGTVTLSPKNGPYLALAGLTSPLTANGLFLARIHFERAGWLVATVHVR